MFAIEPDHLGIDQFDVAEQRLVSHHFAPSDGLWRHNPVPFRYVWPAELDLMARIAGLRLRERWGDWHGSPFGRQPSAVSVWRSQRRRAGRERLPRPARAPSRPRPGR